ncbi:SusC/RagA family TonB-linked outer membrane protein [Christiangramia sp. SM2212]|uniref:SusC/RagA family TonB-linked outer membrane protein n=1 Tax=Christiangramia sediminicola TaxID=3073267 RepID=A0ABU1ETM5_9FLAO|nr:SusC/RagA family TonB-linked outer membrane protein [Christiangramia sp. SM2212]MDR5591747.1 SusC/RagA family TonB-linked outer membrane protein [Christiangramia sp. SM2212]
MKAKFSSILTLLLAFVVQITFAQEQTVSGTVTDSDGLPLPGVNIVVKGTSTGVQTDFDGNYSIDAAQGDVLVFSFVGLKSAEMTVGSSNTIDVVMEADAATLDEVVVTALGISREKKSLGYATQEVAGDEVNTAKEGNFVNSLSGKISGLDVKKSSSIGGSSNVVIRGYSSITGNNQALFVIDGVPVNNSTFNTSSQSGGGNGYDYGNAASDINPDDIKSVNVLKGAAATALYGSRAANGAVIITTKDGSKSKGIGVTVNTTVTVGNYDPDTFAKYQKEYGQGYGPYYGSGPGGGFLSGDINGDGDADLVVPTTEDASYGSAFDPNLMVYGWESFYPELDSYQQSQPYVAGANDPSYIFQTSYTDIENVALSVGGEKGSTRLSYTRFNQTGIMPNSEINRNTLDFSGSLNLTDKLTASAKAIYTKTDGLGRYGTGYDAENLMTNFRQWWAVNTDLAAQRRAYEQTGRNITWNPFGSSNTNPIYWDNPYFTRYENFNNDTRNRLFGYATLGYEFTDWFDVQGRVSVDTYDQIREERNNVGSVDLSNYTRRNINFTEFNYDLFLNFDEDFGDFGVNSTLGANYRQTKLNTIGASTNGGIVLEGLYTLSNSVSPIQFPAESEQDIRVLGLFGTASIDYNDTFYLEGSLRRDTFSTLPDGDNSFNYPAVSTSIIFSNLFDSEALTYGKIRAGYGEVGNGAQAYQLQNTFNAVTGFNGAALYSNPASSKNPNLTEERTNELEIGLETSWFSGRFGFDASIYKKETENQIIPVTISPAAGFTSSVVNSGVVEQKGLELNIFGSPVKTENFEWKINGNFATYESEVTKLYQDSQNLLVNSFFGVTLNAALGEPYGVIKGTDYQYVNGERLVREDGLYAKTANRDNVIGDINPDFKAGIQNVFSYKNWDFSFLIDIQEGGSIFTGDLYFGMATGLYPETAGLNELGNPKRNPVTDGPDSGGIILDGVQADGSVNDVRADMSTYLNPLGRYGNAPDAQFVYDASYVKLREATLSYSLPSKTLDNLPFTGVKFTATGRNLWIIDKDLPYADPEDSFGAGNVQGFQIGAYPAVREYGLNVQLQF